MALNEEIEPEECDSCGYPGKDLQEYDGRIKKGKGLEFEKAILCQICASTLIGNMHNYPNQYEYAPLGKALAYCTNLIINEIRKGVK